jgi:hypothetical protein
MLVQLCPLGNFCSLSCYTSWSMAFLSSSQYIPLPAICGSASSYSTTCHLHHIISFHYMTFVVVISKSPFDLTWHITILIDWYTNLWRLGYLLKYYPWRQYLLIDEIFFISIQELKASTTSLVLDFGCISFCFSCLCFVNSSNATSLHSCYI